ncbi:MAG: nitronate monooxygenase [Deltaproteobacteria bacterium]|nr:MAG: nitronate monooxygenase [Deltaproteobacteria bacterium]
MFKTKITEMFNIEYPIIGGAMMWLSRAELVAAVSDAGGLGIMASAIFEDKNSFREEIRKVRKLTDKPFGININMFPAFRPVSNDDYIDVLLDEGVNIVETSGHKAPEEYVNRLKKNDVRMIHKCVGVRYAQKAVKVGVDAVTVVGYENGGATGKLDITSLVLIPRVVDSVDVPVIGGGGVGDGRGFLAMLSLGAEGVIIGTRLMVTDECPLHPNLKEALVKSSELDTRLVMRSIGATHRAWNNAMAQKITELEEKGASLEELAPYIGGEAAKGMFESGEIDAGMISCGQAIGLIESIRPAGEVIKGIIEQARAISKRICH